MLMKLRAVVVLSKRNLKAKRIRRASAAIYTIAISRCNKEGPCVGSANLLVEGSHGGSVLGLLEVVLGSDASALALSDELDSALVGSRSQVESEDSGAKVGRKPQEREGSAGLDDNSLQAVVQHVRSNKLELLGGSELDGLAEASFLSQDLRIVRHNCYSVRFEYSYLAVNSVVLKADVNWSSAAKGSRELVEHLGSSSLSGSLLGLSGRGGRHLITRLSLGCGGSHGSLLLGTHE
jgi:hypothetical protein